MTLPIIASILAATIGLHAPVPSRSGARRDPCTDWSGPGPLVTPDSIGFLRLRAKLRYLRQLCPSASDTVFAGEEATEPAVVFHLGTVTVLAGQETLFDHVDLDRRADYWVVVGSQARLPLGLSFATPWRTLHASYGQGVAENGGVGAMGVHVEFCRFPGLELELSFDSPRYGGRPTADLSAIPADATIRVAFVNVGPYVGPACDTL